MKRVAWGASLGGALLLLPFFLPACMECEAIATCISQVKFAIEREWGEDPHRIVVDMDGELAVCEWESPRAGNDPWIPCIAEPRDLGGHRVGAFDIEEGLLELHQLAEVVRLEIFQDEELVFSQTFEIEPFEDPGSWACDEEAHPCGPPPIAVDATPTRL